MKWKYLAVISLLTFLSCSRPNFEGLTLGMSFESVSSTVEGEPVKSAGPDYAIYRSSFMDLPSTLTLSFTDDKLTTAVYEFDGSYDRGYLTDSLNDYEELYDHLIETYGEPALDNSEKNDIYQTKKAAWELKDGQYATLELTAYSSGMLYFALTFEME